MLHTKKRVRNIIEWALIWILDLFDKSVVKINGDQYRSLTFLFLGAPHYLLELLDLQPDANNSFFFAIKNTKQVRLHKEIYHYSNYSTTSTISWRTALLRTLRNTVLSRLTRVTLLYINIKFIYFHRNVSFFVFHSL